MSPPQTHDVTRTRYAFWLESTKETLFTFVSDMICVETVHAFGDGRVLVAIKDTYDADEAWHYIRAELERETTHVDLDDLWDDALWL